MLHAVHRGASMDDLTRLVKSLEITRLIGSLSECGTALGAVLRAGRATPSMGATDP